MGLLAMLLLVTCGLSAMAPRPPARPLYDQAVAEYQKGDFEEAGAIFQALSAGDAAARRSRLAFLFERQGYAALALELSATASASERLLLARGLADAGRWEQCLPWLEGLQDKGAALLRAEALDAIGSSLAGSAYELALVDEKRNPWAALACFKAADFSARQGDRRAAEKRYKRCEKLDPSCAPLNMRLAQLYAEAGRGADAKNRLEKALRQDPQNGEARDCLNLLLKAYPGLAVAALARQERRDAERLEKINPKVLAAAQAEHEPLIRVGVLQNAAHFKFRSGSAMAAEALGLTLPADAVFEVKVAAKKWRLWRLGAGGATELAALPRLLRLQPLDGASTLALFDVEFGAGYFWAGKEDRNFRGVFELRLDSLKGATVINELPLDSYLMAVLPSEMPAQWPREALLSQAVAARADTLSKLGRHKSQGFDVCSEVHCQMYRGVDEESPSTSEAVSATAGELLEMDGRPLGGIYMNSCGGHTQDAWDTWSGEPKSKSFAVFDGDEAAGKRLSFPLEPWQLLGWLDDREGPTAWCGQGPGPYAEYRWVARYSREELENTVARRHEVGRLLAVEPLERSEAGYVKRVRFIGSTGSSIGSSDYIRTAIKGLRSNFFYVETRRDASGDPVEFLFHGGGWGHGVGFCQTGAAAMASAGRKHGEILQHYFHGSDIVRRY